MTDNINRLKDLLLDLPEIKCAEHFKSVESAVTTAWGEEVWDHQKLSRDCLQNMVDGCVESNIEIDQIKISSENDQNYDQRLQKVTRIENLSFHKILPQNVKNVKKNENFDISQNSFPM